MVSIVVAIAVNLVTTPTATPKQGAAYLFAAQPLHTELMRCHSRPLATGGTVQECEVK